jgi:hypothetical protein
MKNTPITPWIAFALLICISFFISCQNKKTDAAAAISKNIDNEMVQLADINVGRLKISQQYLGDYFDKRYSDLIKEYENNKDFVSKVNFLDRLVQEEKFRSADKPSPKETKTGGYPGIIRYLTDDNFDLSIKSNDAFVAQVKFMNSTFKTLDQSALDAISFYEKLTPDQKKQYFDMANAPKATGAIPAPDFYQKYISRELLRGYNHYQYHLQALFYNYYKQKTLNLLKGFVGNEGKQTNGAQTSQVTLNDKQFDISFMASNK